MTKEELRRRLEDIYDSRLKNDIDRTLKYFSEGCGFRIVSDSSAGLFPAPVSTREEREAVLRQMIETWQWIEFKAWRPIIDEYKAAIHYVLKLSFAATGEEFETEVVDLLTFDDQGLITDFVEFVDTDQVARLAAKVAAPSE